MPNRIRVRRIVRIALIFIGWEAVFLWGFFFVDVPFWQKLNTPGPAYWFGFVILVILAPVVATVYFASKPLSMK